MALDPPQHTSASGRSGLASLIDSSVGLSDNQKAALGKALVEGTKFYDDYNNGRLALAFASFDREMRLAIYELLFLMQVNHPKLADWRYMAKGYETVNGVRMQTSTQSRANLYLKGARPGVQGMGALPVIFREEYESYVEGVFEMSPYGSGNVENPPIVTIQSVGSIGTIGHKSVDSDLDLQVVYDMHPFQLNTEDWSDAVFKDAVNTEHKWWINQLRRQDKIPLEALRDKEVKAKLSAAAANRIARTYPGLYRYLVQGDREFATMLFRRGADKSLRIQVLHEVLNLMKRSEKITNVAETRQAETLLKQRLAAIQEYINRKFPTAEIYLFVYSVEGFRQGNYSSTLEFKESSGSAYEMILNYDTLMPGIQFTHMLPTHFAMPNGINNDEVLYPRMIDYIRYGAVNLYDEERYRLVDLGNTPDMEVKYIAEHGGAIYWEAFKASSGNLPKATLNLLRFEMLLDKHLLKTTIQVVKEPLGMNKLARPKGEDAVQQIEDMSNLKTGLPPWSVLEIEAKYRPLLQDPWWLRYKCLKIGYHEPEGVSGIQDDERARLSKVIDLAFCLHVRISDVLNIKVDPRNPKPPTHREQVLTEILSRAFPPGSPRRINLEGLFQGGVRGLIFFENELRDLFQRSMTRVEQKMAALNVRNHVGESQEVELWLNFYMENFQPQANVVPRVIMKHLKVARDGIQIAYRPDEGWVFMAIKHKTMLEKSAEAARDVSYLPDRVLLIEKAGFARGIAQCVLNGYYGVQGKGTPNERRTVLELDDKKLNQGNNIHNDMAFLSQEQVRELVQRISDGFPYQPYDYTDILKAERIITGMFVMVNLWRFGQVSIIRRDNLGTWYCDEFEVTEMFTNAVALSKDMAKLLRFPPLQDALGDFIGKNKIDVSATTLSCWANPNSLAPERSMRFHGSVKDMGNGTTLRQMILQLHRPREAAGSTEGTAGTAQPRASA